MTNQTNHQNNVVQEIQRVANEVADVLIEIHRSDAMHDDLDIGIDHVCRETLMHLNDENYRNSWERFYSIYNGVK